MFYLRRFLFLPLLMVTGLPLIAQRQQQQETHADVYVNVAYENDHPVGMQYRVQLLTNGRMPMGEQFTNDRGQVIFRGLSVGSYQLIVLGVDIENTELGFSIGPHESMHTEFIRVKLKSATAKPSSNQGTVSSASLNIPDRARKEFDKGLAAFAKQDLVTAREHFAKAVEIYPQYSAALLNLGVIAMRQQDPAAGQHYFEEAIKADPQNAGAYTYLARVDIMNAKYDDAETLLTKSLSLTPLDPEPLTMMATSQLRSGKFADAVASAEKVHTVPHEHYAIAHLVAAEALIKEQRSDLAADQFRLYLKESPTGANAESARAALQSIENRTK